MGNISERLKKALDDTEEFFRKQNEFFDGNTSKEVAHYWKGYEDCFKSIRKFLKEHTS